MTRFLRRLRDLPRRLNDFAFFAVHPATGPSRDEPPMTAWQCWRAYRIPLRTCWQLSERWEDR